MTIREIEQKTGLERSNIRFYEREGLIDPRRRENGYREYSEADLAMLQKIKLLRRLDFSLDSIRALQAGDTDLEPVIAQRLTEIDARRRELNAAERVCREMQQAGADFASLDTERYLRSLEEGAGGADGLLPAVPPEDRIACAHCPWRRYFARMLDAMLVNTLLIAFLALVWRANMFRAHSLAVWILHFVAWVLLSPIEGLLVSRLGTTPGKWLLGLRLEHADGRRLTFSEAMHRSWLTCSEGQGYTLPVYNLYCLWRSYKAVKTGPGALWDEDVVITVRKYRWWRPLCWIGVHTAALALALHCALTPVLPVNRGPGLTLAELAENYAQMTYFHGLRGNTLQLPEEIPETGSGTLKIMRYDRELSEMQFFVQNGVVRKLEGPTMDMGNQTIYLVMSYIWANASSWEVLRSYQDIWDGFTVVRYLDTLVQTGEHIWEETFFGHRLRAETYYLRPEEGGPVGGLLSSVCIERLH